MPALFGGTGVYSFSTVKDVPVNYYLSVQKEGYTSQSIIVQYPQSTEEPIVIRKTVTLARQGAETRVTSSKLRNIYFDFTKSNIKPEYNPMIEAAVSFMKRNPRAKLLLVGHTDLIGSENHNQNLSERRANAVKDEMVKSGIPAGRIQIKGEGSDYPLASNDQEEEGRELNRRVEFKIIK